MKNKNNNRFEKFSIGEAAKWLIDNAKEVGLDLDGFIHEITDYFIHHVKKEHGNPDKERTIGQIAIVEDDFNKISEIVNNPDYAMIGVKRNGQDMLYYIKKMSDGTTLYVEEIIDNTRNKSLRSKTMFKRKNDVNKDKFLRIVSMNSKTDTSKSKIVSPLCTGSNPSCNQSEGSKAVANPVQPED